VSGERFLHRGQKPAALPPDELAELRHEAHSHATTYIPAAKVRRLFCNLDQVVAELLELRAAASGGAASPADEGQQP
jgi:hypothetical protein